MIIYNPKTGEILLSTISNEDTPSQLQLYPDSKIISSEFIDDPWLYYVSPKGEILVKPSKPNDACVWDEHTWKIDPDLLYRVVTARRNKALAATDWTQAADVPQPTKDKWVPYRQALRDIPQQSGYPMNINWPSPPD